MQNTYGLIGKKIKELRILAGHKRQNDFCEKSGINRTHFSRIENGKERPKIETLKKITDALGVPLYMIFSDEKLYSDSDLFKPDYTLEIKRQDCKEKEKINIKIQIEE